MKASSSVAAPRLATMSCGAALSSTRPACISEMRSQRSASFMKWVEMKMVTLSRRASSTIRRQKLSRAIGSTPEVGSSRISSSGWCTMATASDRRWRMPSGSFMGSALRAACRSKRSSMAVTRVGTSSSGTWNSRACSTRFCSTDSSLYSENACDM
ncbi:hypothetical protein D3C71_1013020 [compost metagenome]